MLQMRITPAGREALTNAQNTGTQAVVIAQIGLTAAHFDPQTTNALPAEIKRIDTFGGEVVDPETLHVTISDSSSDSYPLRGIAAYLDTGVLFSIGGSPDPDALIIQKSAAADVMVSFDVKLADLTTAQITFSGGGFTNPPASETVLGVMRRASNTQAIGGTDDAAAMTSLKTKAYIDNRFGVNAPSAIGRDLLSSQTPTAARAHLGIKGAALKDEGSGNGLDADTLDGQHAAAFLAASSRGVAGGVAPVGPNGQIPEQYIPAVAIADVFVVSNQAAQLALTAQRGDVAVRTDLNQTFMHNGGSAGTMADWTLLRTPTDAVLSVAGRTGAVTLSISDIQGLAQALEAKANLSGATFTGPVNAPSFNGT